MIVRNNHYKVLISLFTYMCG